MGDCAGAGRGVDLDPAAQPAHWRHLRLGEEDQQPGQSHLRDTIPLHAQTAGRNLDIMLIARAKIEEPQNVDFYSGGNER